jgi:drug/metabolite transporter, DME family
VKQAVTGVGGDEATRSTSRRGLAAVLGAAVLWGTVGIAAALLYERTDISPFAVGFARLGLAAVVLALLLSLRGQRLTVPRALLPRVALVGVCMALYQACFFAAVALAGVSIATLVTLGLAPVLVAIGARVFFGDRHGRVVLAALGLALAGLVLLVGAPGGETTAAAAAAGGLVACGSATGYAGLTLLGRALSGSVAPQQLVVLGAAGGAVVLLVPALVAGVALPTSAAVLGLQLYLGLVPTVLAYTLFFSGLRTVRATAASIATLLEPLVAATGAALLLGERLTPVGLVGGALLLLAVVLLARDPGDRVPVPAG